MEGLTDREKEQLWDAYHAGRPPRTPVTLAITNRVYVLDPRFNTTGLSYQQVFTDPEAMLWAGIHHQEVARTHYHRACDLPTDLPDRWQVAVEYQNVYEAWFFGAAVEYRAGQVPDTRPFLGDDNKRSVFDVDIHRPLARDPFRRGVECAGRMREIARKIEYRGRPVEVLPYIPAGTDGPLTVALNLRGAAFLEDLLTDAAYADELLAFLTDAAIERALAAHRHAGIPIMNVGLADDAIEAVSGSLYQERILPLHRRYYDALDPEHKLPRGMHLCGDVQRHFGVICRTCGVSSIDTGFPVEFGALRREVGPEVEIKGGVEVALLLHGTPGQVDRRAREILDSGVREGGRFILKEANNLPPATPIENLVAMYEAARVCPT